MKIKTIFGHNRHSIWLRLLALLMCVITALSLVHLTLPTEAEAADGGVYGIGVLFKGDIDLDNPKVDLSDAMHIIIRHWHAEENPDSTAGDNTVIIGAYIVPDSDGSIVLQNGSRYTCYARAYTSDQEAAIKIHRKNYVKVDKNTQSTYIAIENNKVSLFASPFHDGDLYYERFAGFSVSAGQTAVSIDNGTEDNYYADAKLIIDPASVSNTHLVKSHLFYISERDKVSGTTKDTDNVYSNNNEFPDYIDTVTSTTQNKKYYNTNEGLHTDKTASVSENSTDGRTFDLDLESWYNEGDPVDVGMVLDASGSMGFTANTPYPIQVTNASGTLNTYGLSTTTLNKRNSTTMAGAFLTDEELGKIMNTRKTDNSSIRSSGYTYFVFDARTGTEEFTPLAYWGGDLLPGSSDIATNNGKDAIGQLTNAGGKGWYYNNPSGNWETNYFNDKLQSGKNLIGIPSGYDFIDEITLPGKKPDLSKVDEYLDEKENYTKGNSSRKYTSSGTTPCKFYIDKQGYLRCFYWINKNHDEATGDIRYGTSYVYQNNDQDYVKVEALQRALGSFITGLEDKSPESLVSAVRFSTPKLPTSDLYSLVLLDWTADVQSAQQLLSGQRGEGDAQGKTMSGTFSTGSDFTKLTGLNAIEQFNYGLTGSTSTMQGLNAFYGTYDTNNKYNLAYRLKQYNTKTGRNGKKYLIVFTDGKDTDLGNSDPDSVNLEAYTTAKKLRDDGYTIFCVMLTGGPIQYSSNENSDYGKTIRFLTKLAGGNKDNVFSTQDPKVTDQLEKEGNDASNTVDALVAIFNGENGILDHMSNNLEEYNVQDYIDPRFDLVDADGNVWYLNADGKVVVDGKESDLSKGSKGITLSKDIKDTSMKNRLTDTAMTAQLHYDSKKEMYYLVWTGQTIPGSYVGTSSTKVWHGKVTVRAKKDFLGGNAVLSNGNDELQNYVYSTKDSDASSGIGDMYKNSGDQYPSKGFPRTAVNVTPDWDKDFDNDKMYMGEYFSQGTVIQNMIDKASDNATAYYYWEYLERYINYYNEHLDTEGKLTIDLPKPVDSNGNQIEINGKLSLDILEETIFGGGLKLPYGYLPNDEKTNQTGQSEHETDIIGYLTYSIEVKAILGDDKGDEQNPSYPPSYDDGIMKDTIDREYNLDVSYEPLDACDCKDGCEDCKNCEDCDYNKLNQRQAANEKLVQEKRTNPNTNREEQVYAWDRAYKEEVGSFVDTEEVKGGHTVAIVGGEIALQVELSKDDVDILELFGVTKITYTADLIRISNDSSEEEIAGISEEEAEEEEVGDVVGTFTAEIGEEKFKEIKNGSTNTILAGIKYNNESDYEYKKYGLPIGSYTLANYGAKFEGSKKSKPFIFIDPFVVTGSDDYIADVFDLDQLDGHNNPNGYMANLNEDDAQIGLGEEYEYIDEDGKTKVVKDYLDARFGIFRVRGKMPVGNLSISKTVEGYGDKNKEFTFNVELTPPEDYPELDLAGEYTYDGSKSGTITFEKDSNGENKYIATVTLKHGETITIKDIADEVSYTVTESDNDGYVVSKTGDTGLIEYDNTQKAAFINTPISLTVTKRVLGDPLRKTSDTDNAKFNFELTLKDENDENITDTLNAIILKYSSSQNKWVNQIDDTKPVTVTTADNGLLLSGEESNYVVYTKDDVEYYLYVSENNQTATKKTNGDELSFYIDGAVLIPKDDVDTEWDYDESKYTFTIDGYTVYKNTSDGIGNELDGKIQLSYTAITTTVPFENGVAKFELMDNEGLQFCNITPGTKYTVTEVLDDNSGFNFGRVSDEGGKRFTLLTTEERKDEETSTTYSTYTVGGEIPDDSNAEVHYFNLFKDFSLPLSGGNIIGLLILFGGMLLVLSGTVIIFLSLKRRRRSSYRR